MTDKSLISQPAFAIVIGGAFLTGGAYVLLWIVTGDYKTAATILLTVMAVLVLIGFGVGMALAGALIVVKIQRHQDYKEAQMVDVTPAPQLPKPRRAIPMADLGEMMAADTVWDLNDTGERIEVKRDALEHFLDVCWPVPKRDTRWKMAAEEYTAVVNFLCAVKGHPLQKKGRTFAWDESLQRAHLLHWYDLTLRQARLGTNDRTTER